MSTGQGSTPKQRVGAECARHGARRLVAACVTLLEARAGDVSDDTITVLGGDSARYVLDGGEGGRAGYWPRVWAARGLLHEWDPSASRPVTVLTAPRRGGPAPRYRPLRPGDPRSGNRHRDR